MNLKEIIRLTTKERYSYLDITNGKVKTFFSEIEFTPVSNLWETINDYLSGQDYYVILLLDKEERKIYNVFRRIIYHIDNPPSHPILSYLYQEYKNNKGDVEIICKDGKKINVHSIVLLSYNVVKKFDYSYKIVQNLIKLLYIGQIENLQEKQYMELLLLLDYLSMSDFFLSVFKKFFNNYPVSASKFIENHPPLFKYRYSLSVLITDIEEQKKFVISQREHRMRSNIIKEINIEILIINDEMILSRGVYHKYIVYFKYDHLYESCGFMVYDSNGQKRPDLISYIRTCWRCYELDEENEKDLCSKYSLIPHFSF